jgi:hypothetical protein
MRIEFDVHKDDLKIVIQGLQSALLKTSSSESRARLLYIVEKFQVAYWIDDTIFSEIQQLLDPYTNSEIKLNADLLHELNLDSVWIANYLNKGCNKIVLKLLKLENSTKKPKNISSSEVQNCTTVQDIVDLIKKTYESTD